MKKVLINGPILSRSGYGEMARFAIRALKNIDSVDLYVIPTSWGKTGWLFENDSEREWIDSLVLKTQVYTQQSNNQPQYDIAVQISIPTEWKKMAPINIGYTAGIETNYISPAWVQPTMLMDKVIVISEHAKSGFVNTIFGDQAGNKFKINKPVEAVHLPYRSFDAEELDFNLKHDFNFLTVCQWSPRKNLEQTIIGFLEEFRNEEVGLVLKINTANDSIMDRHITTKRLNELLFNFKDRKCTVTLLHGHLSEKQMLSVYTNPKIKAIVSMTHGEGFGLPLMEAATNNLPVIATDWSAHTEYLYLKHDGEVKRMFGKIDYEIKPIDQTHVWPGVLENGTSWAHPKMQSYKEKLRDCYKDYGRYKSQAKKLTPYVRELLNEEKLHDLFVEHVLGEKQLRVKTSDIPKISIIGSVYNADEYIEGYLEDITNQTIFKDKCELILINANSPGNEEVVIKKYMEKHSNIVYKKLDADPGVYGVWNMGIKMATGEFITNANMDDRKAPSSLERHAKTLLINKDVDLVYADSYIVHEANKKWDGVDKNSQRYNFEQFSPQAMLRGNLPHNNPMWRKTLHDKYGYFNENYKSASDWEFWLTCVAGGSKFKKLDEVLGVYYFNPKGISTNFENFAWKQKEEEEIFERFSNIIK